MCSQTESKKKGQLSGVDLNWVPLTQQGALPNIKDYRSHSCKRSNEDRGPFHDFGYNEAPPWHYDENEDATIKGYVCWHRMYLQKVCAIRREGRLQESIKSFFGKFVFSLFLLD